MLKQNAAFRLLSPIPQLGAGTSAGALSKSAATASAISPREIVKAAEAAKPPALPKSASELELENARLLEANRQLSRSLSFYREVTGGRAFLSFEYEEYKKLVDGLPQALEAAKKLQEGAASTEHAQMLADIAAVLETARKLFVPPHIGKSIEPKYDQSAFSGC